MITQNNAQYIPKLGEGGCFLRNIWPQARYKLVPVYKTKSHHAST